MTGQLYIVKTRGRLKDCGSIEKCSYLLASQCREDIEMKLSYFVDKALYSEFTLKSIERVKPNFHLINRTVLTAEQHAASKDEDSQMKRELKRAAKESGVTLQPNNKNVYAFGCIGNITASSERGAIKRVSTYLARKAGGSNVDMPFVSNGHFIIELLGESDSTRSPSLDKFENFATGSVSVVSGGGVSPR